MSFAVKVNGEVVAEFDGLVDWVSLQSAKGEAGKVGCGGIDSVDIVVTGQQAGGTRRLEDVDREKEEKNRKAAEKAVPVKKSATKKTTTKKG